MTNGRPRRRAAKCALHAGAREWAWTRSTPSPAIKALSRVALRPSAAGFLVWRGRRKCSPPRPGTRPCAHPRKPPAPGHRRREGQQQSPIHFARHRLPAARAVHGGWSFPATRPILRARHDLLRSPHKRDRSVPRSRRDPLPQFLARDSLRYACPGGMSARRHLISTPVPSESDLKGSRTPEVTFKRANAAMQAERGHDMSERL